MAARCSFDAIDARLVTGRDSIHRSDGVIGRKRTPAQRTTKDCRNRAGIIQADPYPGGLTNVRAMSHSALIGLAITLGMAAQAQKPFLPQKPALGRTQIVFSFAGDLWSVPREGGD